MSAPAASIATDVAVGIGANLGDAATQVRAAFDALAALPGTVACTPSPLYRTPAWGRTDQPDFVNAVARLRTTASPSGLLDALLRIEARCGRLRAADGRDRWGPRTLDLDLLLYARRTIALPDLQVPHPRLHLRAFALQPLLDVWPDAEIPGVGRAVDALRALGEAPLRRVDGETG
ncbi:2-amino-4-hydroxy-6-hydroxymethyldihydropteridine diphosphokinase [Luteimonas abyssi]|uniref:2-amino-4-hydroxy-6- hydroxymethyldihydropteridine diphosphokinase n=1 Tax=Luteimonas abyssi TaxID=1247514 RepID=UPI000737B539|nr:2-amino-4-hydroxy-6-hydroxymethyldihydropteridine diphosphokinase [Luteimonas abyssi]